MKSISVTLLVALGVAFTLSWSVLSQKITSTWPPWESNCDQNEIPVPWPPQCPPNEEPGQPTYFPYPYDCRKFYECSNGKRTCFNCAPGTRWNQTLEMCDHEQFTQCVIVTTTTRSPQ